MADTDTPGTDTATAVGALVLGALVPLVLLRRGFRDLVPTLGG